MMVDSGVFLQSLEVQDSAILSGNEFEKSLTVLGDHCEQETMGVEMVRESTSTHS